MSLSAPRWNLTKIYKSLNDPKLAVDLESIQNQSKELETFFEKELLPLQDSAPAQLADRLNELVERLNLMLELVQTIGNYFYCLTAANTGDQEAVKALSRFEIAILPIQNLQLRIDTWLGTIEKQLPAALQKPGSAREHAFFLQESARQSHFLMSEAEEVLANELTLSGGSAWGHLQETLTSQKSVRFELDGQTQELSLPALINLRSHPQADVRQRAYTLEQSVFEEMKEPLAACMNGVKGEVNTLDEHRGRRDCLHAALDAARIDEESLEAMISAIQDALPQFRRYFRAKAKLLGQEKLPWWSLFAPLSGDDKSYTFDEARELIISNYAGFSPELADFARTAFANNWIDAEQRPGKLGGAFCIEIPGPRESRILSNFDGSLDQVMTLAHELGHGFHNYCAFQAGKTALQTNTPMTLAETASIMCETIVLNSLLDKAVGSKEELFLLETSISSDAQTTVDILSRFLFEKEVFLRRKNATLSADEISELMLEAQRNTYGDGLDPDVLNRYAWTWKPHYYSADLSFYNFPYAFGMLFSCGLYAIFRQRGASFVPEYKALLASTGEAPAAELAARFGIDIRSKAFWQGALSQTMERIERYCKF